MTSESSIDCGACTLRPFRASDATSLAAVANEREIWLQLRDRFPHPYHREHAEAFIAFCEKQERATNMAVCVDDRAIGSIGITPGSDIERVNAEIGYWIGKPYWGRGIVTAALRGMTRYAIDHFALTRVFAIPFVDNAGSIRVLEKAGYAREGLMRRSAIKDGQIRDQYLYGFYA
jgi:RimJ/RimL family protein N-acetyltransferase